jgi:hypothetical protein
MIEHLVRFLVGGLMVSTFAVLGDLFKPKSFAGLFAAAPSVALATLTLAVCVRGEAYTGREARSMVGGAVAFMIYSSGVCWYLSRRGGRPIVVAGAWVLAWACVSALIWAVWLRTP